MVLAMPTLSLLSVLNGLSRWLSGKEPICQSRRCKRCGFDPWVRMIPWSRKWQSIPEFLPGKSHGQGSLAGYNPRDYRESDTTTHACHHLFLKNSLLSEILCVWKSSSNLYTDHDMKSLQIPPPGLWGRVAPHTFRNPAHHSSCCSGSLLQSKMMLPGLWGLDFILAATETAAMARECLLDLEEGQQVLLQLLTGHTISLTLGTKGENTGPTICDEEGLSLGRSR